MTTKSNVVAERLRYEIASGALKPGQPLRQRELAERFALSATPVREALRQLQAEGVVVYELNRGVTVASPTSPSLADVAEVYMMRRQLERLATAQAHQRMTGDVLKALRDANRRYARGSEAGDRSGMRHWNHEFHMRIYRTAEMPRLLEAIERLWAHFPWETLWLNSARGGAPSRDAHDLIIAALQQSDSEASGALMASHIAAGLERWKRRIEEALESGDEIENPEPRASDLPDQEWTELVASTDGYPGYFPRINGGD